MPMNSSARAIPADADVRHRALDPERSFIVQAPAGSGKTELLVRRFLRLLARVDEPEEIVALTFTRKAAAEMRARVIDALNDVVADTGDHVAAAPARGDELRSLAHAALRRDAERGWSLSLYPARLRITTLDAWCAALVQRMPWSSGFGSPPQVRTDAELMYREAARATLRLLESDTKVWSQAVDALLERFDNDLPRLETLLVEMLGHRDQWLRHIVGADVAAAAQRAQLQTDWEWVVERELQKVCATAPAAHIDELNDCASHALDTAATECGAVSDAAGLPGAEAAALPAWRVVAAMLLTKKGTWRKTTSGVRGFAAATAPAERRDQLKQLLRALPECPAFEASLGAVSLLPDPEIDAGSWQAYRALYKLLPLAVAQLQLVFQASGNVDFTEIAQRAAFALGPPDAPTDLALALDYRLQHLLVDEFQDTSYTQLDLLSRLSAGWEPEDGRTLFLVGDPMQSIYRFREAEVGIFLRIMRGRFGDLTLESLTLSANFRSQSGLVDWVNTAFAAALPRHPDSELGAAPFMASTAMHATQAAAVTVNPQLGNDPQQEAEWVRDVVDAERARAPGGTIAVLVRSRGHLHAIIPCLRRAGLRYYGVELESLATQSAIQDLVALTRALLHPSDSVAWMTVLRAPWCGLTLADLTALAVRQQEAIVWEAMYDQVALAAISEDGRRRVERVRGIVQTALSQRHRQSLRRWLEAVWMALGGPACVDTTALQNTATYFDLLDDLDRAGDLPDLSVLQRALDSLWAAADVEADGSLQLMTIHKAKGLQFDTVILPGLGRTTRHTEPRLLLWSEVGGVPDDRARLLLAPLGGQGADAKYAYLREIDKRKNRLESVRLLYVACTRAAHTQYLSGHVPVNNDGEPRNPQRGSLLSHIWPAVAAHFAGRRAEPPSQLPSTASADAVQNISYYRLPANWQLPCAAPAPIPAQAGAGPAAGAMVEFSWAGHTARHAGILVHEALHRIADDGLLRWVPERIVAQREYWQARLAVAGVAASERAAAVDRVARAVTATLQDPRGRWILNPEHPQARSEWALSAVLDGQAVDVVLDRTFVDAEDVRWIVDFKTGIHAGGDADAFLDRELARYRPQLERYAVMLGKLERRSIRLGLYFPLLGGWREWQFRPCDTPPAAAILGSRQL